MFQVTYNCKKCPDQEAKVCSLKNEETVVVNQVTTAAKPVQSSETPFFKSAFKAPALVSPTPKFFGLSVDDQSTPQIKKVSLKEQFLLVLLLVNVLSETPGIGSSAQASSQFVISQREVITAKPSALSFS